MVHVDVKINNEMLSLVFHAAGNEGSVHWQTHCSRLFIFSAMLPAVFE